MNALGTHRTALAVVAAAAAVAAVVPGGPTPASTAAPRPARPPAFSASAAAAGADHECVVPGSGAPRIAWSHLHNPVLSSPEAGLKDEALVWWAGQWHMLFSEVTGKHAAPGREHWDIASATSPDLARWSPVTPWPAQPGGLASPDLVRSPQGRFVATYDAPPDEGGATQAKLYYRTSPDLLHWSGPSRLAPELHPTPSVRMIDPALAWTGNGLVLGYKVGTTNERQSFEVAWSPSGSLRGPWQVLGRPAISVDGDTVENYEFVVVDGRWRLVATSNTGDQPWMFTLGGPPEDPASWLRWMSGAPLAIPAARWDSGPGIPSVSYEPANSVFLCALRTAGGFVYATYAGSQELTEFGGWGHAKIGIARSTDLVQWQTPPEAAPLRRPYPAGRTSGRRWTLRVGYRRPPRRSTSAGVT